MAFSDSDNTRFCLVGLRQNVQGKGNADGSILKQDKSPAPQAAPGRSQRPAVRAAFRAFWGRGKGFQNCSEILSGYQIRRHFGTEKPLLASGLPKSQLFQGIGTASIVLSQALSAEKARFSCSRKVRDCVCALSKFWATHIALGPPAEGKIGPVPQEKRL